MYSSPRIPYVTLLLCIIYSTVHGTSSSSSSISTTPITSSSASVLPVQLQDIFIPSTGICYRIPAVAVSPVTSTILFAAERRRPTCDDFNTSHDLVLIRMDPLNHTLYEEQVLIDDNNAWYNPTFIVDKLRRKVHILINRTPLAMNVPDILLCHLYTRETYILTSEDDGVSWTLPRNISNQVQPIDWRCHAVGPGSGIQVIVNPVTLEDWLIVPAYHSLCNSTTNTINAQISSNFYSTDGGINWSIGGLIPSNSTNECQITILENNTLVMMSRMSIYCNSSNKSEGYCRGISHSNDYGLTWNDFYMNNDIIDPACEGSIVNYGPNTNPSNITNNITALFVSVANNPSDRINVGLFRSMDQGNTFQFYQQITDQPGGYSQLTVWPDNTEIGCFFENGNNGTLTLARVPIV